MLEEDKILKRIERHKETQEDFTPSNIVRMMLDLFPDDVYTPSRTFIDYSAGNGNFLVEILDRKLQKAKGKGQAIEAAKTIYGVELMEDNVAECRERMNNKFNEYYREDITPILEKNIIAGDALKHFDYER